MITKLDTYFALAQFPELIPPGKMSSEALPANILLDIPRDMYPFSVFGSTLFVGRSGTINDENWGPFRRTFFSASYGYMTTN